MTPIVTVLLAALLALALVYRWRRRAVDDGVYHPALAWLRAGLYFCACWIVAALSGALDAVVAAPLASAAQRADPWWWLLTGICTAVIAFGYGLIWPRGTFTDGRRRHSLLSLAFGSVWGISQGLLFVSFWLLIAATGLEPVWVAVLSYLAIGGYNGFWHRFVWDIHVSPPHNYTEWNAHKVLFCHTPNLLVCLCYLALYGNFGVFVLLQGLALALSAYAMRFPAFWDDYRAQPGRERSILDHRSVA
jgi:hypothetical protein